MADAKEISSTVEGIKGAERGVIKLPQQTLDFFDGDEIRARVFYEKYALKDANGNAIEKTPEEMWARVASEIASVETSDEKRKEWNEKFLWLLQEFRFLPGGRILFGAGSKQRSTLLNCYVIPIAEDSIEGIFDWCKEAARTYSLGGGVGGDISILRPKNSVVNNSAIRSSGSVSFMELMSETTHTIGQHGRRGALMITIDVDHPDIFDFIRVKQNTTNVRYANISIKVTDEFMRAVENAEEFTLRYNRGKTSISRKIMARELWDLLTESARNWAEPGIIFWDTVKRFSPSEYNGMEVVSTNPCSEQPLQAYGACDLGNINLSAFVMRPFSDNAALDWQTLETAIRYGVRFLDNVLTYNEGKHPLRAQEEAARLTRRIGLGVTALGDMLVKLRIRYDSNEALTFVDRLFDFIKRTAYDESTLLAEEKGAFAAFDAEKHLSMPFIKNLDEELREKIARRSLRNVAILTVPPTGTISVLAGTSSGIEPIFAISYTRRSESLSKGEFKVYHPLVREYTALTGASADAALPDYFTEAHSIDPDFRVRMQGTIQRHIDSAISSTVNLPKETTAARVSDIYLKAWKAGCKGITVYREGSREGILITDKHAVDGAAPDQAQPQQRNNWERPQALSGETIRIKVAQGNLYVTANFEGDAPKEVFIDLGKAGSEEKSYCEALGRLISKYLQAGGEVHEVIRSLKGIRSNNVVWANGLRLYSIPDAIAKALEMSLGRGTQKAIVEYGAQQHQQPVAEQQLPGQASQAAAAPSHQNPMMSPCPECGNDTLVNESGCFVCKSCSYTKCE